MGAREPEGSAAAGYGPGGDLPADLEVLGAAAQGCTACDLYADATQTVFGAGPPRARLMVVGEQPGDREDLAGEPFVGPSGRLLDQALEAAGIPREDVYITNLVKHFKFTRRGKRRIHATPNAAEQRACRPWLDGELAAVRPELVVALGATAAKALLGSSFKVSQQRGEVIERDDLRITATVHPSSLLRAPDEEARQAAVAAFLDDFRRFATVLGH